MSSYATAAVLQRSVRWQRLSSPALSHLSCCLDSGRGSTAVRHSNHIFNNRSKVATTAALRSLSTSATTRSTATSSKLGGPSQEQNKDFQSKGWLDEQQLLQFDTLHELQERACQVYAPNRLFGTYQEASQSFEFMSYGEFGHQVDHVRAVLHDLGVQAHDKVAVISNNRWEWAALAAACYGLNANLVPMYEAQLPSDWTHILNDSGAKVVLAATDDIFRRVQIEVLPNAPLVQTHLCFEDAAAAAGAAATSCPNPHSLQAALRAVKPEVEGRTLHQPMPDDLAGLIYTSGTTGRPKGVELTHRNLVSNVQASVRSGVDDPLDMVRPGQDVSLAILPWAHSYGQTCELWAGLSHGVALGLARPNVQQHLLEDLQLVQPTALVAVPALYQRIYDRVNQGLATASPAKRRLVQTALQLGRRHTQAVRGDGPALTIAERVQHRLLDGLVLRKIRARLGGNLRYGYVAGAACPVEVLNFFDDIGIPVCEGYGLTETSPVIARNTPYQRQIGSVGRPIGDTKVYIVNKEGIEVPEGEEGEICCTGSNVFRGYHNDAVATSRVFSIREDGSRLFHTGDLGRQDPDGFVHVTGRRNEQYKLANGKFVAPAPIEQAIGLSRFVRQVVVVGANRPYNVALVVPEWSAIRVELGIDDDERLARDPRAQQLLHDAMTTACEGLKKFQIPQRWAMVDPFTAENRMLTPKMSIRRHKVLAIYRDVIDGMYQDEDETEALYQVQDQAA